MLKSHQILLVVSTGLNNKNDNNYLVVDEILCFIQNHIKRTTIVKITESI